MPCRVLTGLNRSPSSPRIGPEPLRRESSPSQEKMLNVCVLRPKRFAGGIAGGLPIRLNSSCRVAILPASCHVRGAFRLRLGDSGLRIEGLGAKSAIPNRPELSSI